MTSLREKYRMRKSLRDLRKAAAYRLDSDGDILLPEQCERLRRIVQEIRGMKHASPDAVAAFLETNSGFVASLNPYKGFKSTLRNILDVAAVAFAVAFGIRGLFLQPFKIPTGSMQPTLFGVHFIDRANLEKNGGALTKILTPLFSSRAYLKVERAGRIDHEYFESSGFLGNVSSHFSIEGVPYTLPGHFTSNVLRYVNLNQPWYDKGEVLCDGWLGTGDHVFVERFLIHFRGIKRGDVAVFNTENITSPTQSMGGYYYVKRIAGLPGDTLKVGPDKILMIRPKGEQEFRKASEFHKGFRKTDSMLGGYQGHLADGILADGKEITVPENCYFALGDNTSNSLDGRNWGFIPRRNMIGLAFCVFWPVSRRWGFVDCMEPLPEPTVLPRSMQLQ